MNYRYFYDLFSATYPNYLIGFDLVGQEDKGKPLYNFVNALVDKPKNTKFFFHAGETSKFQK